MGAKRENARRTRRARRALSAGRYTTARMVADDRRDAVTDLLTDLLHYADAKGYDALAILARAADHYACEIRPCEVTP